MASVTKNYRDGVLKLKDGTEYTPNEVIIPFVNANLTWTRKDEKVEVSDRGALSHLREGDEEPIEGSFSCKFEEFLSDDNSNANNSPCAYEAFFKEGEAADWVSTNDDGGEVYTLTMILEITNPNSDGDNERITFEKVYIPEQGWSDSDDPASEMTWNFKSFTTAPTIVKYE